MFLYAAFLLFVAAQFFIPKDNVWDAVFYLCVIPSALLFFAKNRHHVAPPTPDAWIVAAMMIWTAMSLLWREQAGISDALTLLRHTLCLLIFLYAAYCVFSFSDKRADDFFWTICIAAATFAAIISITLYLSSEPFAGQRLRPIGQLEQPVLGASVYGVFGLVALYRAIGSSDSVHRGIYGSVFLLIGLLTLLTYSRGPILAYAVTALVMTAIVLPRWFSGMLAACVAAIMLAVMRLPVLSGYKEGILNRGLSYRTDIWQYTFEQIAARPLTGWGANAPFAPEIKGHVFAHAHNLFLGTLFHGGVVALALMLGLLGFALYKAARLQNRLFRALVCSLLVYIVLSVMTGSSKFILSPAPLWMFFWMPLCYCLAVTDKSYKRPAV